MKLEICLLDCFNYQANTPSFPLVGKITVEKRTEIATRVEVNAAILTNMKNEECGFGFMLNTFGFPRDEVVVTENSPYFVVGNIFNSDDDVSEFYPGEYELELKLTVFEKVGEEEFKRVFLEAKRLVTVK